MTALLDTRPGDRIVAVNGRDLPWTLVVEAVFDDSVRVVPPRETEVEWRLYADVQEDVTLEVVPEPEPPKPRRKPSRVVEGIRLVSHGGGHWESEDGKYGVQLEEGQTSCDDDHPMRFTPALRRDVIARPHLYGSGAFLAAKMGRRGYLCEGGGDHTYPVWTAWAHGVEDDMADTMGEALAILAAAIRRQRVAEG